MQSASERAATEPTRSAGANGAKEFAVREYIGAMALELAQMARWDGDEALARLLESASTLAGEPLVRGPIAMASSDAASA